MFLKFLLQLQHPTWDVNFGGNVSDQLDSDDAASIAAVADSGGTGDEVDAVL